MKGTLYHFEFGTTDEYGMVLLSDDGAIGQFGIFDDPAVTTTVVGDTTTVAGTVVRTGTAPQSSSIGYSESWDDFSVIAGDVDGDGIITLRDGCLLGDLDGTIFGDGTYDPRGDLDLDGDIDSDDFKIGDFIHSQIVPNYDCLGDFNGDGTADVFDIFDFLDAFNAGTSDADVNCDGVIDVFDVFANNDAVAAGC